MSGVERGTVPGNPFLPLLTCLLLVGKGKLRKDLQSLEEPHGATLEQLWNGLLTHCAGVPCAFHTLLGAWVWETAPQALAGQQPDPWFLIPFLEMDLNCGMLGRGKPYVQSQVGLTDHRWELLVRNAQRG